MKKTGRCADCRWWRERAGGEWCANRFALLSIGAHGHVCDSFERRRREDWESTVRGNRGLHPGR